MSAINLVGIVLCACEIAIIDFFVIKDLAKAVFFSNTEYNKFVCMSASLFKDSYILFNHGYYYLRTVSLTMVSFH